MEQSHKKEKNLNDDLCMILKSHFLKSFTALAFLMLAYYGLYFWSRCELVSLGLKVPIQTAILIFRTNLLKITLSRIRLSES